MKIYILIKNNLFNGYGCFHGISRKIIFRINKFFNIRLSSKPYISGDTFRTIADIRLDSVDDFYRITKLKNGSIIFCKTELLKCFTRFALPRMNKKFILITHNSDEVVDVRYLDLLNNELLIHWFAQNNCLTHKKITSIPIGLENRYYHNNGIPSHFKKIALNETPIELKILYSFSIHTNIAVRQKVRHILQDFGFAESKLTNSKHYKRLLSKYAFVASPEGNGIDCHRTWEALYLGVIPIVSGSKFYSAFPMFPGLVLDHWEDLLVYDEKMLLKAHKESVKKLSGADFIWMDYWENIIQNLKALNSNP
jgi:hypothetical protein